MIIHHGKKSTIKEILYPEKKSNNKFYQIKNLHDLREREERNRKLKEDKINYVEPKLYKLKAFENVPSKLKQNTQDWITKEKKKKPMSVNNFKRPVIKNSRIQLQSRDNINKNINNNNVLNIKNNKTNSLFDNYYNNNKNNSNYAKIGSKENSLYQYNYNINHEDLLNNNNNNISNTKNEIDDLGEDEINQLLRDYNEHLQQQQNLKEKENEMPLQSQYNNLNNDINNINNEINNNKNEMEDLYAKKVERDAEIQKIIEEYTNKYGNDENIQALLQEYNLTNKNNNNINNNINSNNLKEISEVPESLEQTLKKPNNENKQNKNKKKLNSNNNSNINTDNNVIHKDYGKTPEYIKKYKMEEQIKKEEIKRKQEEAKLPPGTKLLSEEERLSTLDGLINSKKELTNLLEKMPITTKTLSMQNKKEELIKKLDEIEKAIDMFSKKEVYIKI